MGMLWHAFNIGGGQFCLLNVHLYKGESECERDVAPDGFTDGFTLGSDKDQRKIYFRFRSNIKESLPEAIKCACLF